MKISFCLITLNEEGNLRRCLGSLSDLADEIVVVDSGSTDRTEAIAREFGAKWERQDWPGYVAQKNKAISLAQHEWVFSIDADEELSAELKAEIRELKAAGAGESVSGYSMPRCVLYEGRWIRHGDWYPDRLVRLFRRGQGRFAGGKVHERLEVNGRIQRLKGDLYHYSFADATDHWARCQKYSHLWAETRFSEGRQAGLLAPYFRAAFRWFRGYVLRLGFLDGAQGWRIALQNSREVFFKYSLLRQMCRQQSSSPAKSVDNPGDKPTRWLVLSYFSNIDGMAAAQHLDDRIPHLKALGIAPVLLTSICGESLRDVQQYRVPSIAPSGMRYEARHWLRRWIQNAWLRKSAGFLILLPCLPFYLLEKLIVNLDSQWSWFLLAALRGRALCRKYGPTVIYSTGGPPTTHLAAAMISRRTGLPWIAEFQDPVIYEGLRRSRRAIGIYEWVEQVVARRASKVVFLTNAARLRFVARTGAAASNLCTTIYPGATMEKVPSSPWRKGNTCRFAHVGTLAGTRNLRTFFEALKLLLKESPGWLEQMEVHLYGHADRASAEDVQDFSVPGIVHNHGRVPRQEALSAMNRCDVLLLVHNADPYAEEAIPFKFYEYLFAGRPILGLTHKNPELAKMLRDHGHFAAEVCNVPEVHDALADVLKHWKNGFPILQSARSPGFTVKAAVRQLASVLDAPYTRSHTMTSVSHDKS